MLGVSLLWQFIVHIYTGFLELSINRTMGVGMYDMPAIFWIIRVFTFGVTLLLSVNFWLLIGATASKRTHKCAAILQLVLTILQPLTLLMMHGMFWMIEHVAMDFPTELIEVMPSPMFATLRPMVGMIALTIILFTWPVLQRPILSSAPEETIESIHMNEIPPVL